MGNILGEVNRPSDSVKAYRNFLRLYSRQHGEMHPNDAANIAIRLWGTLTPSEKQRYEELVRKIKKFLKIVRSVDFWQFL